MATTKTLATIITLTTTLTVAITIIVILVVVVVLVIALAREELAVAPIVELVRIRSEKLEEFIGGPALHPQLLTQRGS